MHIRRVEAADLPEYASVGALSMWDDEIIAWTAPYRNQYPISFVNHFLHRTKRRFYAGQLLFVAVTDQDDQDWNGCEKIIGYSCYTTTIKARQESPRGGWLGAGFETLAWRCEDYWSWLFQMDRSAHQGREQQYRTLVASDTTFDDMPNLWELELLGVHPAYQRRGIGSKLLEFGFEQAKRDQVPLVVIASISGEKLYLSLGFKELNRITVDPQTGVTWAAMIWDPPTASSNPSV